MDIDQVIPDGYMRNAAGHLVPEDQVREHDKLRDQTARDLADEAIRLHALLKAFKDERVDEIMEAANVQVWLGSNRHAVFYPLRDKTEYNLVLL